jgi:hypothetical protein
MGYLQLVNARRRHLASLNRRTTVALWVVAAYAIALYASFRWGNPHPTARFPGSD